VPILPHSLTHSSPLIIHSLQPQCHLTCSSSTASECRRRVESALGMHAAVMSCVLLSTTQDTSPAAHARFSGRTCILTASRLDSLFQLEKQRRLDVMFGVRDAIGGGLLITSTRHRGRLDYCNAHSTNNRIFFTRIVVPFRVIGRGDLRVASPSIGTICGFDRFTLHGLIDDVNGADLAK